MQVSIEFSSKISQKLQNLYVNLLEKYVIFSFDEACRTPFEETKNKLIKAPIVVAPNWGEPFEIMCDAGDYAVGAVL